MRAYPLRQRVGREAVKLALSALLRWRPTDAVEDGFSIVLGVPWDLRHLLSVNLRFVEKTDLSRLKTLYVVLDRCFREDMPPLEAQIRREFPNLPLEFLCYPAISGWVVEKVDVSTFYNSMNTTLALGCCKTKYAVLHDFDLYPLCSDHFTSIVDTMHERGWRFSGHELTHFDGLTDKDQQIGTWTLGIDVEWLRATYRPVDCFHRVALHGGRPYNLDPYAWVQFRTADRGLSERSGAIQFCHVMNLCSTYLRFLKRAPLKVAWRMHYLWYLEELSGRTGRLRRVVGAMRAAEGPVLEVDRLPAEFSCVHVTCANVLEKELNAMEETLFGGMRDGVREYVSSFRSFLYRFGDSKPIIGPDGNVVWSPEVSVHCPAGVAFQ